MYEKKSGVLAAIRISGLSLIYVCVQWLAESAPQLGQAPTSILGSAENNSQQLIAQGKQIFRFDTFGDQAFWGDQLQLYQAINTLTPRNALALGLKIDSDALSPSTVDAIKEGKVNLNDPAVTRMLIKQNAVLESRDYKLQLRQW